MPRKKVVLCVGRDPRYRRATNSQRLMYHNLVELLDDAGVASLEQILTGAVEPPPGRRKPSKLQELAKLAALAELGLLLEYVGARGEVLYWSPGHERPGKRSAVFEHALPPAVLIERAIAFGADPDAHDTFERIKSAHKRLPVGTLAAPAQVATPAPAQVATPAQARAHIREAQAELDKPRAAKQQPDLPMPVLGAVGPMRFIEPLAALEVPAVLKPPRAVELCREAQALAQRKGESSAAFQSRQVSHHNYLRRGQHPSRLMK